MKNKIVSIIIVVAVMILTSCVREELLSSSLNGEEGESVKVELSFKIPPASSPQQLQSRSESVNNGFSVEFFKEASSAKTRSGEVTELYNLWLFQFNSDGSIHGSPQQVSDQVNMVNDMALLNVSLHVGTDQTLYIVVLGKKVTATSSLTEVRTMKELENIQLDYIDNRSGLYYSRITNENEVPYAGAAKGISVKKIGDSGEIVYGTPEGFSGGIEIKRLVSRVTLKHKFDVTENTLEGMRLLKVPTKLCINPASVDKDVIDNISMVDLESDNAFGDTSQDTDGFFTSQWYVAQNKQGTVSDIISERDRYRKVTDGSGKAPASGTNIEAWSYSKTNRSLYTVHQIYVGKNNTDNFDVEINNYYDIRTIINSSDLKDGRIRSYTAVQKVYLSSVSYPVSSGTDGSVTLSGATGVYFDAHYGWRPVIINAQGRKVTVGIYKDANCTQLVDMNSPTENWLQLSSYPNYTEVVRNGGVNVLKNQMETNIFVPTRFKLYLYADEYVTDENGVIVDSKLDKSQIYKAATNYAPSTFVYERTLYVKVTTEDITAEGVSKKKEGKYTIKQKRGHYAGLFGGDMQDGQYTKGLIIDAFNEHSSSIDDQIPASSYMYSGYYNVMTNYVWSNSYTSEQNYHRFMNGKQATFNLATNPDNYVVNQGKESIIPTMRKINGQIDLYQYNYYNSYHARFCHDLNRDKNGNGVIDHTPDDPEKNELEWYLPSIFQAMGVLASAGTIYYGFGSVALASEEDATYAPGWSAEYGGWYSSGTSKNDWKLVRCVRDIPVPQERKKGTKVTTYTDGGDKYVMIDLTTLPYGITDRTTTEGKKELYEDLELYSYSTTGKEYTAGTSDKDVSKPLNQMVSRVKKNRPIDNYTASATSEILVSSFSSPKFIVSPTDVYNDGDTQSAKSDILQDIDGTPRQNSLTMTWAEANGRLNTANSQGWNIASKAMNTGCYAYKGKSGKDTPGSWRVPNSRELSMILMFAHEIESEKYSSETGFIALKKAKATEYSDGYWSSTEAVDAVYSTKEATSGAIDVNYGLTIYGRAQKASKDTYRLRCIKDIP